MICWKGLTEKAEKLLQAGHSVGSPVKLTRREEEVLGGVMKSLANKEIAATLNLSERTVKFHVSSLLAKFRVRGRMELVREASRNTHGADDDANADADRNEGSADVCAGAAELQQWLTGRCHCSPGEAADDGLIETLETGSWRNAKARSKGTGPSYLFARAAALFTSLRRRSAGRRSPS